MNTGRAAGLEPLHQECGYRRSIQNETPKKALGDKRPEWHFHCQIPHAKPNLRNGAWARRFERHSNVNAHKPDWPAGAAGFEPLHLEIRSAELHPASTGSRRRSGSPLIRDAQVRVPPPGLRVLANSDSNMQYRISNDAERLLNSLRRPTDGPNPPFR